MPRRQTKKPAKQGPPLSRVVLVDADVFFAPRLRDIFMYLHMQEVIRLHWTKEIEAEWTRNVVKAHGADSQDIQDCLLGMRDAAPGWEVLGYKRYESQFSGVEAKDQHVAAAAYKLALDERSGQAVALVTKNVSDFPANAFTGTTVLRYILSGYLTELYKESPNEVLLVFEACRGKLKNPTLDKPAYIEVLRRHGCKDLAAAVEKQWGLLPKV